MLNSCNHNLFSNQLTENSKWTLTATICLLNIANILCCQSKGEINTFRKLSHFYQRSALISSQSRKTHWLLFSCICSDFQKVSLFLLSARFRIFISNDRSEKQNWWHTIYVYRNIKPIKFNSDNFFVKSKLSALLLQRQCSIKCFKMLNIQYKCLDNHLIFVRPHWLLPHLNTTCWAVY